MACEFSWICKFLQASCCPHFLRQKATECCEPWPTCLFRLDGRFSDHPSESIVSQLSAARETGGYWTLSARQNIYPRLYSLSRPLSPHSLSHHRGGINGGERPERSGSNGSVLRIWTPEAKDPHQFFRIRILNCFHGSGSRSRSEPRIFF